MPTAPTLSDLAPEDRASTELDFGAFEIQRIRSTEDASFPEAFARLEAQFGPQHAMEQRAVIARRFSAPPAMLYELVLVKKEGRFAAVRDHTAIALAGETVVHLSHNLVAPEFRRSGLAGWMRTFPITAARELTPGAPTTLVAEMEYADAARQEHVARARSYERGGFRKIDPQAVRYHQPDFRAAHEIDGTGGARPLPMTLCVRLVGREDQTVISGEQVRRIVNALYAMYGVGLRAADMAHPALSFGAYPSDDAAVALLPLSS